MLGFGIDPQDYRTEGSMWQMWSKSDVIEEVAATGFDCDGVNPKWRGRYRLAKNDEAPVEEHSLELTPTLIDVRVEAETGNRSLTVPLTHVVSVAERAKGNEVDLRLADGSVLRIRFGDAELRSSFVERLRRTLDDLVRYCGR